MLTWRLYQSRKSHFQKIIDSITTFTVVNILLTTNIVMTTTPRVDHSKVNDMAVCSSECDGTHNQCLSTTTDTGVDYAEGIKACSLSRTKCKSACELEKEKPAENPCRKTNTCKDNDGIDIQPASKLHPKKSKLQKQLEHEQFLQNLAWSNCNDFYQPCNTDRIVERGLRVGKTTKKCLMVATRMCYKAVRFVLHGRDKYHYNYIEDGTETGQKRDILRHMTKDFRNSLHN